MQVDTLRNKTEQIILVAWEPLPHHPYSPDLVSSDFHLFQSSEHFLRSGTSMNKEAENSLSNFSEKNPNFFKRGLRDGVVENDSD